MGAASGEVPPGPMGASESGATKAPLPRQQVPGRPDHHVTILGDEIPLVHRRGGLWVVRQALLGREQGQGRQHGGPRGRRRVGVIEGGERRSFQSPGGRAAGLGRHRPVRGHDSVGITVLAGSCLDALPQG
jgi:hypothetical protein